MEEILPHSPGDEPYGKSVQTRRAILLAAAKLFSKEGYNATTMRRIAEAANLEAGSIYYHFGSKDQILDEVLDIGVRQLYEQIRGIVERSAAEGDPFRKTFAQLVDTHLCFLLKESDFTSANIRNFPMLSDKRRKAHRPLREAYAQLWRSFLQHHQDDLRGDISVTLVSQFILGAMNWTAEWYDSERYPVSLLSERLSKLLLDGMCTKRGGTVRESLESLDLTDGLEPAGKAERTRHQILRTAARILRESGYKAATIRRVASEAGLEAGSVYYHFGSKEEILDEVLDLGLRDLLNGVSHAAAIWPNKEDHRNRIATAIATHMAYLFRASEFTSANIRIYGMLPEGIRSRHRPVRHQYAKVWDRLLREAQTAGALRSDIKVVPLRQAMLGALNWTVEWFDPGKGDQRGYYTLSAFTDLLIKMLLDGISANGSAPKIT
ncbi:TetR family transcriptional regulator [Aliihoeflea aestuarii]|jgi:AcrR family transcriptional regulator|uniref:TetR/AcrR family transcriptional regulator n=1 Tax=Aliihoeflea aestuarii TaxID=453840 RepID=UPI0020945FE1|nr:TetR family transcriptional regulator [Aliihoeflea aestuarii]MCO6392455.1 TetR family transcriptional regulator [Aliihoeflea aestuarii]